MNGVEYYTEQIKIINDLIENANENLCTQLECKYSEYDIQKAYTAVEALKLYLQNCEYNKRLLLEYANDNLYHS